MRAPTLLCVHLKLKSNCCGEDRFKIFGAKVLSFDYFNNSVRLLFQHLYEDFA